MAADDIGVWGGNVEMAEVQRNRVSHQPPKSYGRHWSVWPHGEDFAGLADGDIHIWLGFEDGCLYGNGIRSQKVVRVEKEKVFSRRVLHARVSCRGKASIFLEDIGDVLLELTGDLPRIVCRSIVDNDDFFGDVLCAYKNALQAFLKVCSVIEAWNDNRD